MHLLKEARHADGDRRPNFLHVLRNRVERLSVGDRGAAVEVDIVDCAFGHVRQRQEREAHILGADVETAIAHVGAEVGVREHHALRRARRAGRVDDARKVVRARRGD